MYRPDSHRLIAQERENQPDLKDTVPLVAEATLNQLPALQYADPIPVVSRTEQVTVLTAAMVHGASVNVDNAPRKVMLITFTAEWVEIGLPPD